MILQTVSMNILLTLALNWQNLLQLMSISIIIYKIGPTYNHVAIKFHMIDEEKILSIIKKLKHKFSSGSDSISNHLLKYAATTISKPLMVIINQMLTN